MTDTCRHLRDPKTLNFVSACGFEIVDDELDFILTYLHCPKCGLKMRCYELDDMGFEIPIVEDADGMPTDWHNECSPESYI